MRRTRTRLDNPIYTLFVFILALLLVILSSFYINNVFVKLTETVFWIFIISLFYGMGEA